MLPHKEIVLPEVDLSHDEGDPRWHEAGGQWSVPVVWRDDGTPSLYRWTGLEPGHYSEYWRLCVAEPWNDNAARFESNPDDAYAAWWYVDSHPVFWQFNREVHPDYPVNHVSHLEMEGALLRGWPEIIPFRDEDGTGWGYEFGERSLFREEVVPGESQFMTYHDWKLDGWAKTYEEAVIDIAKKIWTSYGNDRRVVDSEEWRKGGGDGKDGNLAEP